MSSDLNHKQITINPRIIKHLGRDLITAPDVAVVELVKNSIDAKANQVNLSIFENDSHLRQYTHSIASIQDEIFEFLPEYCLNSPFLIVEDNGKGMNDYQLDKGFLEIGTGLKLNDTEDFTLGEKGIGRLAAQRLGKYLLVETASMEENYATLTFIDWDNIITPRQEQSQGGNYLVPYKRIKKSINSYTRLWIFDINVLDFIDTPTQLVMHFDDSTLVVNRDLKSAINFLLSPYSNKSYVADIKMFYNNMTLNINFPEHMLNLSESTHFFEVNNVNEKITLNYSLVLQPWFIERVHRVLVKSEAFKRLRKSHGFYKELLENNEKRIQNVLSKSLNENELKNIIVETFEDLFSLGIKDKQTRLDYSKERAEKCIYYLKKILPINGEIYSFKQNTAVGQNIIIESVMKLKDEVANYQYSLNALKQFLKDYNGIKLYRDVYRIGFLGNKDNDWIELQQFRTKGQQWYRFDLGNTLGYVSVNDPEQKNIQEISSRLDISENEVSDAFKTLINIIFNKLFYELNRRSNSIIKVILEEEGLLGESLNKQVKKSTNNLDKVIKKNQQMLKSVKQIATQMIQSAKIDGESAFIPLKMFNMVEKVFHDTSEHFQEGEKIQFQAANLLAEADKQLRAIEVETYNNYKLMANGLITETITHELHSISKTGIEKNMKDHFVYLKEYFVNNREIPVYNQHLYPVKTNYDIISKKLNEVGNLYSFLENTFIKKGTYDEFVQQNIKEIIEDIKQNLLKVIQENNINIRCTTDEMVWFVPKGVLIHVFYNLINNSIYWIDKRRKFAETDESYLYDGKDEIVIEELNSDAIIVSDTGTGVMVTMEDILFEPLESGKPGSEGRGMGLYIVRKLLNSFNSNIELLPDRNEFGNKYKFLITLDTEEVAPNVINNYL